MKWLEKVRPYLPVAASGAGVALAAWWLFSRPEGSAGGKEYWTGRFDSGAASARTPEFYQALVAMCRRFQIDPRELYKVMIRESEVDPSRVNPTETEATGLIQITRGTATRDMKMSLEEFYNLRKLTATAQLPYVEKYFRMVGLPKGADRGAIYKYVFMPGVTPDADGVLVRDNGNPKGAYRMNEGLDINPKDKAISISDLRAATNYTLSPSILKGIADAERELVA